MPIALPTPPPARVGIGVASQLHLSAHPIIAYRVSCSERCAGGHLLSRLCAAETRSNQPLCARGSTTVRNDGRGRAKTKPSSTGEGFAAGSHGRSLILGARGEPTVCLCRIELQDMLRIQLHSRADHVELGSSISVKLVAKGVAAGPGSQMPLQRGSHPMDCEVRVEPSQARYTVSQ